MGENGWTKYICKCGEVLYSNFPYGELQCQKCGDNAKKEEGRLYTAKEVSCAILKAP